jgi:hypothetical protein
LKILIDYIIKFFKLNAPTSFVKLNNLYFIVDCWNNRILYSKNLSLPVFFWNSIKGLNRPHKIIFFNEYYFICDTDNHKIIKLDQNFKNVNFIGKFKFIRPHDIVIFDNSLLIIDGGLERSRVIKINPRNELCKTIFQFPHSYSRSIYIHNKNLYVCSSSNGIIRIISMKTSKIKEITSFSDSNLLTELNLNFQNINGTKRFIPNGVIKYENFWYLTNYFLNGTRNRFIQFENWDELKKGNFIDLSNLVSGVPYYLSIVDGLLAVGEIHTHSVISIFKNDKFKKLKLVKKLSKIKFCNK